MKTAIIQARIGSSRLPGKVLAMVAGRPLLAHVIERVKRAKSIDQVILATTTRPEDAALERIAVQANVRFFAGNETDVLDRYYQAAVKYGADVIIRITADCPLLDPHVVDRVVERYLEGDCDYACNGLHRTYPDGLDTEVFSFGALEKAWKEAALASEREHVTPYIWKNPEKFRLANVENSEDLSELRWSVDEERDLEFVREVYKRLYRKGKIFYMEDVLALIEREPAIKKINQGITINEGYAKSVREDRTVK